MKKLYITFLLASTGLFAQGSLCTDPIIISSLPYSVTDDTANYLDSYDPQTDTHPTCSTTTNGNYYHGGNDVIYSFTATTSTFIKVEIPTAIGWTGMFIYTDCANIGIEYAACATGTSVGPRTINNFAVVAGQTYFIFISSWPAPQTVAYSLNVTDLNLATDGFEKTKGITIYPNPASDRLFFKTNLAIKNATVYLVNGQRINLNVLDNEASIASLQSGLYIIEMTTSNGEIVREKFVKK